MMKISSGTPVNLILNCSSTMKNLDLDHLVFLPACEKAVASEYLSMYTMENEKLA